MKPIKYFIYSLSENLSAEIKEKKIEELKKILDQNLSDKSEIKTTPQGILEIRTKDFQEDVEECLERATEQLDLKWDFFHHLA